MSRSWTFRGPRHCAHWSLGRAFEWTRTQSREARVTRLAIGLIAMMLTVATASAQRHEVTTRNNITYAERDGTTLAGDLYRPQGIEKPPVVVAVHGEAGRPAAA